MKKIFLGIIVGFIISGYIFFTMLGTVTNRVNYNTMHDYDKEFTRAVEDCYGNEFNTVGEKIYYFYWKIFKSLK